ncbi:Magnesium-protoporphyrin O-methyltransferase [Posidoniimonas polymericola]|uniref:Magnesium-protoporphyrin O-methyltransferase n=1 Tax=Posidoniimonas polymericola TaxID=2528002 RepID=A0A5C5ZDA6_9BACT|nr:class I SAM-dependent methyltransferase [Posidoniimonas polymericola]TWT85324.1 Magnesium-protoporphyrin O-methyltransferase [Posidoniimonas polymericola]
MPKHTLLPLLLAVCRLTSTAHAADEYLGRTIARTMHYTGAPWLVRDSREREEEPEKLVAALGLEPGQQVCDLGCGNGFYALKMAEKILRGGVVWAVDIQPEMLDLLRERAEARQVTNVKPVLGDGDDPKLPAGQIDLLLLVDVYHEIYEPAAMLTKIHASLAARGRVALVEFRAEDPNVPIKPLHKMTQAQCVKEFRANNFKLVGQYDKLPWQHVLFFAREDSPLDAEKLKPWTASE